MFLRWFTYFWLGLTLFLLLKPGLGFEESVFFTHEDKVVHFVLFLTLTLFWHKEIGFQFGMTGKKTFVFTLIFGLIIAGFSELAQHYIPRRGMDLTDFLFNVLGIVVGMFFYLLMEKSKQTLFK